MTKEQEEAIELLGRIDITYFLNGNIEQSNYIVDKANETNNAIETVLNMLKEKDKIIDLMAEYIFQSIDIEEDICNNVECKQGLGQDIICINCIIQYFENKVNSTGQ